MSYTKAMKWNKKHPKGTKQNNIMHTDSGFWPSLAFIEEYEEYEEECKKNNVTPLLMREYYKSKLR
jgi:hypothetical protein